MERLAAPLAFSLASMCAEHLDAVLEIERAAFSNPWARGDFQYAMEEEGNCLVALADGRVIAYSVGFVKEMEFHLADFAVHPEFRRRGIGGRFLDRLMDLLQRRPLGLVTLEVRASNVRAQSLYAKAGFEAVAMRKDYYSRPREDAFVMVKALQGDLADWIEGAHPLPARDRAGDV